jgi:hypothetical protein
LDDKKLIIRIFDFDGTLFNSPNPNPALWDKKMIGRLKADYKDGGLGWYQNVLTLDDKYIQSSGFNDDVVAETKKSMSDPNSITVFLTGRSTDFTDKVNRILGSQGLVFDERGLKPFGKGESTMEFKQRFIKELVDKYNPVGIEMWDDRVKHVTKFNDFLDSLNLNNGVHFINNPDAVIQDADLEKELVDLLMKDPRVTTVQVAEKKPDFHSIVLDEESRNRLIESFKNKIPEGWKTIAHHMTVVFGNTKNEDLKKFLVDNVGKSFQLNVVELGISPDAMAVKIQTEVPSTNKIKHITIAIPEKGKPVNSNFITEWNRLSEVIQLNGVLVSEVK